MKFFLIVVIALSMAPLVSATVVLTSYPQASNSAFTLNGSPPINDAAGFTMGTTGFNLTSARVQFSANGIAQFSTSQIAADLYGGTAGPTGTPSGSPLVSFTIPAATIAGPATDVTMTPAAPFTLQASTSYWLVLHANSSVGGNLGVNAALNPAAGPFATYIGLTEDGSLPPQTRTSGNVYFEINGTAVPEPTAACVVFLGAALPVRRRGQHV